MANFYEDNDDLRFYVERAIDWGPLVAATEMGAGGEEIPSVQDAIEMYRDVLTMVGEFSAEAIAPLAPGLDKQPLELVDGDVVFPKTSRASSTRSPNSSCTACVCPSTSAA